MSESLHYSKGSAKAIIYQELLPQLKALMADESNYIANLANVTAVLKEALGFFWVGFYLVEGHQLVLGPFQGSVACTRINKGKGVCGKAWEKAGTIIVPDVDQFPGHIACSSKSRSEIVVPVLQDDKVVGVLDVDSDCLDAFDEVDAQYLEQVVRMIRF
ncbi:MAG: GAF domain-containing protein [Bacteroidota bacterium]|nr:GAF domain-containing protein [Bacteroidota bacterium]